MDAPPRLAMTGDRFSWPATALGALSLVIGVLLIGLVFALSGTGYDLTDEGYYLASIAHYAEFPVSSTQFGFVYHPLYLLVGGNVALLRICNLAITLALSAWLAHDSLNGIGPSRGYLSVGAASTSLTVLNGWLASPSYNSLAVQAVLLCMIGLVLVMRRTYSFWPWVLVGIAGWLAFMAKPPTAIALALIMLVALRISGFLRWLHVCLSALVATACLLLSALAIDGLPSLFIARLQTAVSDGEILQGVAPISTVFLATAWPLSSWEGYALAGLLMLLAGATATALSGRSHRFNWTIVAEVAIAGLAMAAVLYGVGLPNSHARTVFWRMSPCASALGGIVGLMIRNEARFFRLFDRQGSAIILCLAALPFAVALGSNVNCWIMAGCASICWTLAGLRVAGKAGHAGAGIAMVLAAQAAATMLVFTWIDRPYRQIQSLLAADAHGRVASGTLHMSADRARYVNDLRRAAIANGFRSGEAMIDLTGRSPGTLFAIGAAPVAEPWLPGGYPGSVAFARRALLRTSCGITANGWLLVEPGGPRAISPTSVGLQTSGYRPVVRVEAPASDFPAGHLQWLLRPLGDPDARYHACVAAR